MKHVVILGAGISGLAIAWFLQKKGFRVTLVEKEERVGGWIQTIEKEDFLFELGPRGFRENEKTLSLVRELSIENELLEAAETSKRRFLYLDGKLCRLSPFFVLKRAGFFSLFREGSVKDVDRETVADYFLRHFPRALLDDVIDPFISGIYAGDPHELSLGASLPFLKLPFIKGLFAKKRKLLSFRSGVEALPKALSEKLREKGADIHLASPVTAIKKENSFFTITIPTQRIEADFLISTLPPKTLAKLLSMELPEISCASLATVNLGYRAPLLRQPGYGYLIPSKERESILGVTWDSHIFPTCSPKDSTRLCVLIGGRRFPEIVNLSEKKILEIALNGLQKHLGIEQNPDISLVHVARDALPQYTVGHLAKIQKMEKELFPIRLAGHHYYGVGINECLNHAATVADQISLH